ASKSATCRRCRCRRWRKQHDRAATSMRSLSPWEREQSELAARVASSHARSRGMRAPSEQDIVAGNVLLAVENVSLAFGGVKAVAGVSFDVRKGEIRAIIGPNGAGKTSLLNVINGFYHPQQGRITFKGKPRAAMRPYEAALGGIARTFQNVALFKGMTALDNIMAGRTLKMRRGFFWQLLRVGPALTEEIEQRRRVEEISDFLKIQHIRKVQVGKLPYGLQKRVELGRALAMEPDLLLLDEPMAGMNLEEKEDMSRFILDVNAHYGTTIALIEHDMGVVMDLSDRVLVLDHAVKMGDGQADQAVIDAYLGLSHWAHRHAGPGSGNADRRPHDRGALLAGRARIRADLQGFGRVQLRAGGDGAVRRAVVRAAFRVHAARHRIRALRPHHDRARLCDRVPGAAPPGQSGGHHPVHGNAGDRLLSRRFRTDRLGQRHLQDRAGATDESDLHFGVGLSRRVADRSGRAHCRNHLRGDGARAGGVF